jgi:hypothetical protein
MATTNLNNRDCPNCNKSGLAVLPVRYAVVPHSVSATLPERLGNRVSDVKLAHHKYALRILRQGFVYLFYEKHSRGSHIKWETYSVSAAGTLWKQLSINAITPLSDEPACSRTGHNIPASVIAIEKPEKCGKVWMAFSEHAWSTDTFELFEKDRVARDRRMQTFEPAKWIATSDYRHGLVASEDNVQQILEYKDRSASSALLPTTQLPALIGPDGSFVATTLKKQTTRYPFCTRQSQTTDLVKLMKNVGATHAGKDNPPAIVALWDAVGITHELAGFAHDVLGWVDKYNHDKALEIDAMNAIEGLKKALPEKAVEQAHRVEGTTIARARAGTMNVERRANAAHLAEPQRSQMIEVCDLLDYWASKNLHYDVLETQLLRANELPEPERSAEIASIRAKTEQFFSKRDNSEKGRVDRTRAHAWPKYEKKINQTAYEDFQRQHAAMLNAADRILEDRTADLIAWLESSSLVAAFTEFHTDNIHDGLAFNEQVAEAVHGINASVKGGALIDKWIQLMKRGETNLLGRAIALNQKESMAELGAVLAEANEHQTARRLASTINWIGYTSKSLKALADTYKKVISFQNANAAAAAAGGSKAFGATLKPVNMRGIDKLVSSTGDRFFKAFGVPGLADHASEKIIQHIFSLRAFVSAEDSAELIEAQAKNEGIVRSQQLQRLRTAKAFMAADTPAIRTVQSEALGKAWEQFKAKSAGAASSMKDARLALLVMLIEGVNFAKLAADCEMKKDAKIWWSLTASGLTITSTLFETASVPAKALFGAESWSYQRIKLAGGLLGSTASAIGAVLDFRDAAKFSGKKNFSLFALYAAKGTLGSINAGLTVASAFTYAAPLIGRLTGNAALGTAIRVVGTRAAAVIGMRILFMSAGVWVTVLVFGVQVLIWMISDDALEEWCLLCAFGKSSTSGQAFRSTKTQANALDKALLEIGS